MQVLRTHETRFDDLPGYPFMSNYVEIGTETGMPLRLHYVDEGPKDGELILCMHGQPSWSFLYRKMIPPLVSAGYRVIAPDLIGFGKSDKPDTVDAYSYQLHVDWMTEWLEALDLRGINLVCQDWGGLIGLRLAGENVDRFKRLIIANTTLPGTDMITAEMSAMLAQMYDTLPVPSAGDVAEQFASGAPGAFLYWVKYCADAPDFSVRDVFGLLSRIDDPSVLDGYEAPFPDQTYMAGARKFPSCVPLLPAGQADREKGDAAWSVLEDANLPVLTAFSDRDPVTKGGEQRFIKRLKDVRNVTIKGGGHFLQEDTPQALVDAILAFIEETKGRF